MTKLNRRSYRVRVLAPDGAGLEWRGLAADGLNMSFEVTKSRRRGSNKAKVSLWNLSDDSIGLLEQPGAVISLVCGYEGAEGLIFSGDITDRGVKTTFSGQDRVTEIEAGARELALRQSRSDLSFEADVTTSQIIEALGAKIGVGVVIGDTLDVLVYEGGFVHVGLARDALDQVAGALGANWSIQDGQLQVLAGNEASEAQAIVLAPDSGLVGRPKRVKEGIEATSLLQPALLPNKFISIESRDISGFYIITEVKFTGEFRGSPWYAELKGRAAGGA